MRCERCRCLSFNLVVSIVDDEHLKVYVLLLQLSLLFDTIGFCCAM